MIIVADDSKLDYETASSHLVTLRATDSGLLQFDKTITITVLDASDPQVWVGTPQADTFHAPTDNPWILYGLDGDDQLYGNAGNDRLIGGAGNDALLGGAGDDSLRTGEGSGSASGGDGNDVLIGGSGGTALAGDAGDDILLGGAGGDSLDGGAGDDVLYGEEGDDHLASAAGVDVLDGGEGIDHASIDRSYSLSGISFTLAQNLSGSALLSDGTTITSIERVDISGSDAASDLLTGGTLNDVLRGHGGDDILSGLGGNDQLLGGGGSDALSGGSGDDAIDGEAGNDALSGGTGNDSLDGGVGNDELSGDDGDDRLTTTTGLDSLDGGLGYDLGVIDRRDSPTAMVFSVDENLAGVSVLSDGTRLTSIEYVDFEGSDAAGDSLTGGAWNDTLSGHGGDDELHGSGGSDVLFGDTGNDILEGGDGSDHLDGGVGIDTIDGGIGADSLVIDRYDSPTALDFSVADNQADWVILSDGTQIRNVERVTISGSIRVVTRWKEARRPTPSMATAETIHSRGCGRRQPGGRRWSRYAVGWRRQ